MRLGDVDHQKCDAVAIILVEFVESGNLPPKGRSGVASKHQNDGAIFKSERRELYLRTLIEPGQRKIRRDAAHLQRARTGMRPECFEREQEKRNRPGNSGHYPAKAVRRLSHHAVKSGAAEHPKCGNYAECNDDCLFNSPVSDAESCGDGFYGHGCCGHCDQIDPPGTNAGIIGRRCQRSIVGL
jgi:hypothetical protein